MAPVHYLFFGFASEYVLHPLYQYLQKAGLNCIEIDLFTTKNAGEIIQSLKGKPVVFLNSAHLFFDRTNFATSYQYQGEVFSPLEIIDYLKPIKSACFPHDFSQLFHEQERQWLSLFDVLFIPRACPPYLASHPQVVNVGWIKRSNPVAAVTEELSYKAGFAFCDYEYHRRLGPEQTYALWRPILEKGVSVKFPHWYEIDRFESYFKAQGVNIFPSTASLSDFIDMHGVILCNGASSVNTEAAFSGRKIINMLYGDYTEESLRESIGRLPNIDYFDVNTCATYLDNLKENNHYYKTLTPPQIKPFDFKLVQEMLV